MTMMDLQRYLDLFGGYQDDLFVGKQSSVCWLFSAMDDQSCTF